MVSSLPIFFYLELAVLWEDDEVLLQGAGTTVLPGEVHQLIVLVQRHQALPLVGRHLGGTEDIIPVFITKIFLKLNKRMTKLFCR